MFFLFPLYIGSFYHRLFGTLPALFDSTAAIIVLVICDLCVPPIFIEGECEVLKAQLLTQETKAIEVITLI